MPGTISLTIPPYRGDSSHRESSKRSRTDTFNRSRDLSTDGLGGGDDENFERMDTHERNTAASNNIKPVTSRQGEFLLGFGNGNLRNKDTLSFDDLNASLGGGGGTRNVFTPTMLFGPYADFSQKVDTLQLDLDNIQKKVYHIEIVSVELDALKKTIAEIDIVEDFNVLSEQVTEILGNQKLILERLNQNNNQSR